MPGKRMSLADLPPKYQKQLAAELYSGQEKREIVEATPGQRRMSQDHDPLLNKLETDFKSYMAGTWQALGCIVKAQALRLRLGNGAWFKVDFVEFRPLENVPEPKPWRITAYEIKGSHVFRGGFEYLKVAAAQHPEITWKLCWKGGGGEWIVQTVLP